MTEEASEEKRIYLPTPEGYRRGMLQWKMGFTKEFDVEPEELVRLMRDFMAGEELDLELHDAQFGEPWWLTRAGAHELIGICVSWVKNPAPQEGKRDNIVVAREMPNQARENARRIRRALN